MPGAAVQPQARAVQGRSIDIGQVCRLCRWLKSPPSLPGAPSTVSNRLPSYPIVALLVALAGLPLAGTGWFATGDLRAANAAQQHSADVEGAIAQLIVITDLRAQILEERNWILALRGMEMVGLTPQLVTTLSGIDVPDQTTRAQDNVDRMSEELGLKDVSERIAEVRVAEESSLAAVGLRYADVETTVAEESDRIRNRLLELAGSASDGEQLIDTLRILEASIEARQSMSAEFSHFFASQFDDEVDVAAEVQQLIAARDRRHRAQDDILSSAAPDSAAVALISEVIESESLAVYEAAADELIAVQLGTPGPSEASGLTGILADLDRVAVLFTASTANGELYLELVNASAADMSVASQALAESAQQRYNRAGGTFVGFIFTSLMFTAMASQIIAKPVRRLSMMARSMSEGSPIEDLDVRGPDEVRRATRALNDAAATLDLAERQAQALADGDLDNPILTSPSPGRLGESLQEAVRTLAQSMQDGEQFRRRAAHDATHDSLTSIANRRASLARLEEGLERVRESDWQLAVLFIDLDGFKDVNDRHGHLVGDAVLQEVANRLVGAVRKGDHVGRLGGDEFLVIAEPIPDIKAAFELAERILAVLEQPVVADNVVAQINASIGIAVSDGTSTQNELLRDADLAVYKAKDEGKGRIELCDDALRNLVIEQSKLDQDLIRALQTDEMDLVYQPIVDANAGDIHGFEALVRWHRPGHGTVRPDAFIPYAEQSDLIILVDRWVISTVAGQVARWNSEGLFVDLSISINVSGRHLASTSFVDDVLGPLRDHGVSPDRVIIEVTESSLTNDLKVAAERLATLRRHGVRIAIDDFGTGYTSLAHLKLLPVDILKVDRSFTSDDADSSLLQLIIDTGHLLGVSVTAEGLETEDQAYRVVDMGADMLQGYLFGRPVLARDLFDYAHLVS